MCWAQSHIGDCLRDGPAGHRASPAVGCVCLMQLLKVCISPNRKPSRQTLQRRLVGAIAVLGARTVTLAVKRGCPDTRLASRRPGTVHNAPQPPVLLSVSNAGDPRGEVRDTAADLEVGAGGAGSTVAELLPLCREQGLKCHAITAEIELNSGDVTKASVLVFERR